MSNLPNPYVGPRAYEAHETLYGRDREIRQLAALLVAERIVLLHSPSGAGKTSLLQAGLMPRMSAEDFYVLPVVRVNLEAPPGLNGTAPNRYLLSTLLSLEEAVPEVNRLDMVNLPGMSLDMYLNNRFRPVDASSSELIIFDQFEEVLTVAPSDREGKLAFFEQLGAALRNRDRWAVFSMREDYVAALAPYLRPIPNRLSAAFRLDLLGRDAAMQAIQKPARAAGVDFTTLAAEKLVDDLSQVQEQDLDGNIVTRPGLYVEPVQLQVVCYRLWDTQVTEDLIISVEDLSQVGSVDDSLASYYAESVARVAGEYHISERDIREWFGTSLITPEGVRAQVLQRMGASDGLDNRAINKLVDAHILRAEKRAGSTWFELAHDRMITPIRKSNKEWFEANLRYFQVQAGLWDKHGRGEGMLLRGDARTTAEKEAGNIALTPVERDFLEASAKAHERRTQDTRRKQVNAILSIAVTIAIIVMIAMGISKIRSDQAMKTAHIALSTSQAAVATSNASEMEAKTAEAVAESERALAQTAQAAAVAERKRAEYLADFALSRQLMMQSQDFPENLGEKYELKGLLAVEAARLARNPVAIQTLNDFLNISGRTVAIIEHDAPVTAVAISPDGRWGVSGSSDGTIRVWGADTGKETASMQHGDAITCVLFSADSRLVISGSSDRTARVWEAATGKEVARMQHEGNVTSAAISPDSHWVISGSEDGTARVWEAATGGEVARMQHDGAVNTVAFSADNHWVVSGSYDGTIQVWEAAAGKVVAHMLHDGAVNTVAFSADNRWVVSGSYDGTTRVWEAATGKEVTRVLHDGAVNTVGFSADNRWVVSGSYDGTARVWEAATGKEVARMRHGGAVNTVAFSSDDRWVVSGSYDGTTRVWEAATSRELARMHYNAPVFSVAIKSDSTLIVSGSEDKRAILWDAADFRHIERMPHDKNVTSLAFRRDGRMLVTGSYGSVQVWEAATETIIARVQQQDVKVLSVAFSPDGRMIVHGGSDGMVWISDAATGIGLVKMQHGGIITSVAYSPDGSWVVSGSKDGTVRIWETATGTELMRMQHDGMVTSVVCSPDGSRVASGSKDGTIRIWDAATGTELVRMQHEGSVTSVAFSNDRLFIASGGEDKTTRVWEAASGLQVLKVLHGDPVTWVTFTPDSQQVTSVVGSKMIQIRAFRLDALIWEACSRLKRNMNGAEWRAYIGELKEYDALICPNLPAGGE